MCVPTGGAPGQQAGVTASGWTDPAEVPAYGPEANSATEQAMRAYDRLETMPLSSPQRPQALEDNMLSQYLLRELGLPGGNLGAPAGPPATNAR